MEGICLSVKVSRKRGDQNTLDFFLHAINKRYYSQTKKV